MLDAYLRPSPLCMEQDMELTLKNLTKRYGQKLALDDFSYTFPQGRSIPRRPGSRPYSSVIRRKEHSNAGNFAV